MTALIAGSGIARADPPPVSLSPARLFYLGRDLSPAHAHVIQIVLAHRSELTPVAAASSPCPDDLPSASSNVQYPMRQGLRLLVLLRPAAGANAVHLQRTFRASDFGNGPSTRSTNAVSQYSLICLILPLSTRQTMQYSLS